MNLNQGEPTQHTQSLTAEQTIVQAVEEGELTEEELKSMLKNPEYERPFGIVRGI